MKIALLTIWHEKNYGAELQAYATVRAITELGHDVKLIDIRLSDAMKKSRKRKTLDLFLYFSPIERKFNRFWKKYIPTTRRYKGIEDLIQNPPEADIYMVGSDQVWNPDITREFSEIFFLNFGDKNTKRVSYASSFGVEFWEHEEMLNKIKGLLSRFNCITCREQSGVKILKDTFQLQSMHVIDPTLLHDDYQELIGVPQKKPTLAYYPLSKDLELEELVHTICSELDLIPHNISKKRLLLGTIVWDKPGIEQWVKGIAESQFVITRSFHGLAFCLVYNKQFAMLATRNNRSTRITDLLKLLGIENRYFKDTSELIQAKPWKESIDYKTLNARLNIVKEHSIGLLKEMLSQ